MELGDIYSIPSEPLAVLNALILRSQRDIKVGLTQQELSRATRLSVIAVREALGWLEQPTVRRAALKEVIELPPYVSIMKKGTHHVIKLLPTCVAEEVAIPFTFEDTDDRRIEVLEKEVARLAGKDQQSSALPMALKGDKRALLSEIESDLGRPVTTDEAYLLGASIEGYGVERVKREWRLNAHKMKRPILGIWAKMRNGGAGKAFTPTEEQKSVVYKKFSREELM